MCKRIFGRKPITFSVYSVFVFVYIYYIIYLLFTKIYNIIIYNTLRVNRAVNEP